MNVIFNVKAAPILLVMVKMYFMKLKTPGIFSLLLLSVFAFSSCSKNGSGSSSEKARLQVYLTDDPASYDQVMIDVQDIKINYSSDTANGWVSLAHVNSGSYDILKLVNDNDTLLADAELNTGRIEQIRLILGPNNFVKVNGQTYQLETPSAQQSGLKLNIHQDVNAGVLYKLLLDFDAARSIVKTGNNKYILKPVIRTSLEAIGGSLKGYVTPNTFGTNVFAIQGVDTVAGTLTYNGSYMIRGLTAGTYNLAFAPSDTTYKKQTKTGIVVNNNAVTTVDTVKLVH
jgi:hypothetical protein